MYCELFLIVSVMNTTTRIESIEFVTLLVLDACISIRDCFKTNIFMYENTDDRTILHLRYALQTDSTRSLYDWINDVLVSTEQGFLCSMSNLAVPTTAYSIVQSVIGTDTLRSYERKRTPVLINATKVPCVLDYYHAYDRFPNRPNFFFDMGDFKEVPFIGSGVSLTYDQTNVRAKTSVIRYTAFPSIDEENDFQCIDNDSNNQEFGFEMLFI